MTQYIWHNGQSKDINAPLFSIDTRLRYGDGVFDTMLAVDGEPIHALLHLNRLLHGANILGIQVNLDLETFTAAIRDILTKNALTHGQAVINTYIVRNVTGRGLFPNDTATADIIMRCAPAPAPTKQPIKAIISKVRRNEGSPLSHIKSMNYGDNILARKEAERDDANEALMLNNAGNIACFTIGNVFIQKENKLYTPPLSDGALDGIIRGLIVKNHRAQEQTLTPDDLKYADAVYLTNSVRGVVPITFLDTTVRTNALPQGLADIHLRILSEI